MWDRRSALNFDEMYETPVSNKMRSNDEELLPAQTHKLKLARLRFSYRTRPYWNLVTKEIRHLKYGSFKREAKKFVIANAMRFLNLGNKDKIVCHRLSTPTTYEPQKKSDWISKKRLGNENETAKAVKPGTMNSVSKTKKVHKAVNTKKLKKS